MENKFISQKEFVAALKEGKREFSDALMQFFDVSNLKLSDIVFKNCKLLFCTFRNCEFRNVAFENCTIYFGSFYTGIANNLNFEKSSIELTGFDTFQFSGTKIKRCNIRWCGILNSNASAVDVASSTCYKLITDISQLSSEDVEKLVSESMGAIGRLDIGIRMKLKEMIQQDLKRYNLGSPKRQNSPYNEQSAGRDETLTYGEVRVLIETAFGAYGPSTVYKAKKTAYETKDVYSK